MIRDGYAKGELEAALDAADAGDWIPLEAFTQQHHVLAPYRINTGVYMRADHTMTQRIEYHRGLGQSEGWWREVKPLFAPEAI